MDEMNTERRYSVADMDRMRAAIQTREIPHPSPYGDKAVTEWRRQVDDRVRSYMLAGIAPEEIEEKPILYPRGFIR